MKTILLNSMLTISLLVSGVVFAAESTEKSAPNATDTKMDHSPADGKAMRNMKEPSSLPSDHDGEHIKMDHSPADGKAMRNMKDKANSADVKDAPCEEHVMMDHSPADGKAMRNMKEAANTHQSGDCKSK